MGKSSELYIRMKQLEIKNTKDIPEYLIKEIKRKKINYEKPTSIS